MVERLKDLPLREMGLKHIELWVAGENIHNHYVEYGCCPDFSCCHPELAVEEEFRKKFLSLFKTTCDTNEANAIKELHNYLLEFATRRVKYEFNSEHFVLNQDNPEESCYFRGFPESDSIEIQQYLWSIGMACHDYTHNRCCPDFSCCHPELASNIISRKVYIDAIENDDEISEKFITCFVARKEKLLSNINS